MLCIALSLDAECHYAECSCSQKRFIRSGTGRGNFSGPRPWRDQLPGDVAPDGVRKNRAGGGQLLQRPGPNVIKLFMP